jgi:hypothetical protein
MTLDLLREIFGWGALINMGLLLWWLLFIMLAHDWTYRFHGRWFKLTAEQFDAIHYQGMAIYKIGIFLFYIVPWLALHIVD